MLIDNTSKKFVVIAPLSAVSKRLRLLKIANFVHDSYDIDISHIGWERRDGDSEENKLSFHINKKIILKGGGYGGSKVKYMYLIWMIKVFVHSLSLKKTDIIWALGFESAFPAYLASKIRGFKVIFDDADRFSLVFNFPEIVSNIIKYFEKITSRGVFLHIIPGIERYDFNSSKFYILKNMPSKVEIEKAKDIFKNREWPKADVVINVNGWLGQERGIDIALQLSKRLIDENIHFILAGRLACEEAELLSLQPNVTYLGNVTNAEALSSYYASDFVLTYFRPITVINTLAESNKWGDAIKTGIGIIVNNEVKTAQYLRDANAAISFRYNDIDNLVAILKNLCGEGRIKLTDFKDKSQFLSEKFGFFEDQLKKMFQL